MTLFFLYMGKNMDRAQIINSELVFSIFMLDREVGFNGSLHNYWNSFKSSSLLASILINSMPWASWHYLKHKELLQSA